MLSALSCFGVKQPMGKSTGELIVAEQPRVRERAIVSSTAKLFPNEIVEKEVSGFFNLML